MSKRYSPTDSVVIAHATIAVKDALQPISQDAVWQLEVAGQSLSGKSCYLVSLSMYPRVCKTHLKLALCVIAGASLVFGSKYRVKHVLTQKYLAVFGRRVCSGI